MWESRPVGHLGEITIQSSSFQSSPLCHWHLLERTEVSSVKGRLLLQGASCHIRSCVCVPVWTQGSSFKSLRCHHCPWPFGRLSSELSLNCLLLQCPKVAPRNVHSNVLNCSQSSQCRYCLHKLRAFSALDKCWCSPGTWLLPGLVPHVQLELLARWSTAPY